eukprot:COSAG02_NODE_44857_length_362_cov_0.866920_1_plen_99_part_10
MGIYSVERPPGRPSWESKPLRIGKRSAGGTADSFSNLPADVGTNLCLAGARVQTDGGGVLYTVDDGCGADGGAAQLRGLRCGSRAVHARIVEIQMARPY